MESVSNHVYANSHRKTRYESLPHSHQAEEFIRAMVALKLTLQVFSTGDTCFFHCFLGLIGSGKAHISTVASIAQAQNKDSRPVPAVAAFASLGSYGAHASNQERDLHRWLRNLHGSTMELYYTDFKLEVGV